MLASNRFTVEILEGESEEERVRRVVIIEGIEEEGWKREEGLKWFLFSEMRRWEGWELASGEIGGIRGKRGALFQTVL